MELREHIFRSVPPSLIAAFAAILSVGVLVYLAASEAYFINRVNLTAMEPSAASSSEAGEDSLRFVGGEGDPQAEVVLMAKAVSGSFDHLRVHMPHAQGTKLHYLRIEIGLPDDLNRVSLIAPSGNPWPMARFHRSRDGNSVIYEILEMGQQGEGTTTVEFLWDNSPAGGEAPIDIGLEVEFRMHRVDSLKFTSWRGVGRLSVATPPIE